MLVNLDNEVYFKHVFTDVQVFCAFVKDVLGIDLNITKVETEKVLLNRVSAIKFRMDLFAEDANKRTVVEIQKVDYDYTYDRFTHYFISNMIDMQRNSKTYTFEKEVYIIVIVTSAYRISDKNGAPIKDDVLITDVNPRNLQGETRDMHNHKMIILNTAHVTPETPTAIRDWLELISESVKNPYNPHINTSKPAIARAAQLAEIDSIDPEQLADAKIQEMRKATVALVEDMTREKVEKEMGAKIQEVENKIQEAENKAKNAERKTKEALVIKALKKGRLTPEEIAEDFDLPLAEVLRLQKLSSNE